MKIDWSQPLERAWMRANIVSLGVVLVALGLMAVAFVNREENIALFWTLMTLVFGMVGVCGYVAKHVTNRIRSLVRLRHGTFQGDANQLRLSLRPICKRYLEWSGVDLDSEIAWPDSE